MAVKGSNIPELIVGACQGQRLESRCRRDTNVSMGTQGWGTEASDALL